MLGQQPGGRGRLGSRQRDKQVFQADVAVPGELGLGARGGKHAVDRR
jgi:hypothetical protein